MTDTLKTEVEALIKENPIVLFMKGDQNFPMCGFSGQVVKALEMCETTNYKDINILEREDLRTYMKEYSDWPTFPQLYVAGEFVGGCDIVIDMLQSGELQKLLSSSTTQSA